MMGRSKRAVGIVLTVSAFAALGVMGAQAKGIAPLNVQCDRHAKASSQWNDCIAALRLHKSDSELFYAGYWLAKNGRYQEALQFLNSTKVKNERILTYIGFATRKSGDIKTAMGFYAKALALNPDFTIARSYLGEAYLSLGDPDKARAELSEISNRCGISCAEYKELEDAIAKHTATRS